MTSAIRLRLLAAASAIILLSLHVGMSARAEAASCADGQLKQIGSDGTAGNVPVVFVHGINADATTWKDPDGFALRDIPRVVAKMPQLSSWTFDYAEFQPHWVTHERIGPALGRAISCLADVSGYKPVVVGHSMGGLAARVAVSQPDSNGGVVGDRVSEVITIATPHRGSKLLTGALDGIDSLLPPGIDDISDLSKEDEKALLTPQGRIMAITAWAVEKMLGACAGIIEGLCAVPRSPQGEALVYDSSKIAELPPWPKNLPVRAISGDMQAVEEVAFLFEGETVSYGDGAVTLESAIAYHTAPGEPLTVTCKHVDTGIVERLVGGIFSDIDQAPILVQLAHSKCNHINIKNHHEVVDAVSDSVEKIRDHQIRPGDSSTPDQKVKEPYASLSAEEAQDAEKVHDFLDKLTSREGENIHLRIDVKAGPNVKINPPPGSSPPGNDVYLNDSCTRPCTGLVIDFPESLVKVDVGAQGLLVDEVFSVEKIEGDPSFAVIQLGEAR